MYIYIYKVDAVDYKSSLVLWSLAHILHPPESGNNYTTMGRNLQTKGSRSKKEKCADKYVRVELHVKAKVIAKHRV